MKRVLTILILCGTAFCAEPPAPPAPHLSDASRLAIRDAQVTLQQIQLRKRDLESQYSQLDTQEKAAQAKLSEAVTAAFQQAGLKPAEWSLDDKLELVAVPKEKKEGGK